MHNLSLKELPAPPPGKTGWPWTEESPKLPDNMPNGSTWPRISIVTPSFNQGQFIEETIRSVLLQGYPNLEYIIIDGGSTDNTVDIINKYEKWLTYWVSEPDRGQSHGINKGFANASGEIYAYINSDDFYELNAFRIIAPLFTKKDGHHLVVGECTIFNENVEKRIFKPWWPERLDHFLQPFSSTFAQPASFWTKYIYDRVGGFDEAFHFCLDQEFFLRIGLADITPCLISDRIAHYREHANIKTRHTIRFFEEDIPVIHKYAKACGISEKRKRDLLNQCLNEINYIQVFICWKKRGRFSAMNKFLGMILKSPSLLVERKILGLARRLISFRAKDVAELKNV